MVNTRHNPNVSNNPGANRRRRGVKRKRSASTRSNRTTPVRRRRGRPVKRWGGMRVGAGAKPKDGEDIGERQTQRRAKDLRTEMNNAGNYRALRKTFLQEVLARFGKDTKFVIKTLTSVVDPILAQELRKCIKKRVQARKMDADECLSLLITNDLTKSQYDGISQTVNDNAGVKILRSYGTVAKSKESCKPQNGVDIGEAKATCKLQNLVEHTVRRTVQAYSSILDRKLGVRSGVTEANFTFSYGMDSATGQRQYKQKFLSRDNKNKTDKSYFAAVMNPLVLKDEDDLILWRHPCPQSPLTCRPIIHEFQDETPEHIRRYCLMYFVCI